MNNPLDALTSFMPDYYVSERRSQHGQKHGRLWSNGWFTLSERKDRVFADLHHFPTATHLREDMWQNRARKMYVWEMERQADKFLLSLLPSLQERGG